MDALPLAARVRRQLQPPQPRRRGECSHGPPTEPCDHHAEISIDDPQLSDEARAWMAAHPDEKLPLHLCPTEGDCNRCPERHDCKWHSQDGVQPDIEDMLA